MSNLKNINLEVSKYAMYCIDDVIAKSKSEKNTELGKKYKTLVKKMPALIQKNGLIGTLAFIFSKNKNDEHAEVFKNIINWNLENDKINDLNRSGKFIKEKKDAINKKNMENMENYIDWMCNLEPTQYRQVTKEMMILFGWIKRFADALIKEDGI